MDITEELFSALFAALIVQWTRRFLRTKERIPDWDKQLPYVWAVFGIMIPVAAGLNLDYLLGLTWVVAFGALIQTARLLREYQPSRTLFMGLLPFMAIIIVLNIIEAISKSWIKAIDGVIDVVMPVAMIWMVASFFFANRQRKEWIKLEAERAIDAERRRQDELKKQELEYLVSERTAEIMRQKEELQHALAELKSTQDQLIQREKLASLGELTAGIAHEIQNPLNFVNNFSEVSAELVQELKEEREKTPDERDQELELELLEDLIQNLQKITHHGGRASSIVRGMLQHSRASTGQRELTDLNALADEYLKLSYHGLRAKDKTFNAKFEIVADPSIGQISMVSQDIGRVLLNLFNNAFYATQQRRSGDPVKLAQSGYQPTVTVTTECADARVRIRVRDNGTGMPEEVKAKIFQPFFTTKPTGEGTGLGLSLAYDIVTKGHGGTLTVQSAEGEGTEFVIELPG
jgi:two-component system, NtrC family, sensor kinase